MAAKHSGHNDAVDFFYKTRGLQPLYTQVELSLSASNLLDRDIMSKSDPMAVVYLKKKDGNLEELGRTEVVTNSLNPAWIAKIPVTYNFEIVQHLVFRIYDIDTNYQNISVKELNLHRQDFVGEATCVLSEIITKPNQCLTLRLHNKDWIGDQSNCRLTVHAEETAASRSAVELVFRCIHLENVDLFSKSDPYLRISRIAESGGTIPIYQTEVVDNNLNPTWKTVCLTTQQFGSKDNPLIFECFDYSSSGNHKLLGYLKKSISDLEKLHMHKAGANLVKLRHGREKVLKGQLFVDVLREKRLYSFLDYICNGFELNFMVAVDFTSSNGNPRNSHSLHYIDPTGRLNCYQRAIVEAGEVLQFYDYDQRFHAWGFGGRKPDGNVSYCFDLTLDPYNPEVNGVEGIMAAYSHALHNVALAGPTLVGQVINKASEIAAQSMHNDSRKYYVLLLITDGVLTDLQDAIDAIVNASDLPLSILIVGVGNADFTQMKILDGDNGKTLRSSTGQPAKRDIVQFVPMREVDGGQISCIQALLEELPGQFLAYMRSRNIFPPN